MKKIVALLTGILLLVSVAVAEEAPKTIQNVTPLGEYPEEAG